MRRICRLTGMLPEGGETVAVKRGAIEDVRVPMSMRQKGPLEFKKSRLKNSATGASGDRYWWAQSMAATGTGRRPNGNCLDDGDVAGTVSPAALEALRRDRIPPEALKLAGDGDPNRAPASLVGVLGEAQPIQTEAMLGLAYSPGRPLVGFRERGQDHPVPRLGHGEVKRILKGHTGAVSAVAFSKDSKSLVSASHDGTIKLWPVEKEEGNRRPCAGTRPDLDDGGKPRWPLPGGRRSGSCDQALEVGTMGQASGSRSHWGR